MSNQTITRAEVTDKIVSEVGLTRQESSDSPRPDARHDRRGPGA
jgi:hypothetical protein